MRIKLATDSKIPNGALMKFSAWCKQRGHEAGWFVENPDYVLISCIFKKNYGDLLGVSRYHPKAQVIMGGPGSNPRVCMTPEIESMKPDYSLYPTFTDSLGFVTSGCFRKCPFCVVPQQQSLHYVQPVWDFYQGGSCRIMDDSILAMPNAFRETCEWLIENKVKTKFEYLDIRLVTEEIAQLLSEIKFANRHQYFAYDIRDPRTEKTIEKNVEILADHGLKARLAFYLYIHSKSKEDLLDAMERWRFLKSLGVEIFGMCNNDNIRDYKLKKRVCRPAIHRKMTPEEIFFPGEDEEGIPCGSLGGFT